VVAAYVKVLYLNFPVALRKIMKVSGMMAGNLDKIKPGTSQIQV
jgi:hypothetical protein